MKVGTLVIMAAGMGSRYGGKKQIDGIGPDNEMLMEYAIYDAIRAGFGKVVFVIKPEMEKMLRVLCGDRIAKQIEVDYAFQSFGSLPEFYTIPDGRTKPYGTVHAILAAKDYVNTPFAILNADDYYGVDAFKTMHDALLAMPEQGEACMIGYHLKNTVSANGTVTRGICRVTQDRLQQVQEIKEIQAKSDGIILDLATNRELDPNSLVSMNFWGFSPWIFSAAQEYFETFLKKEHVDSMNAECLLPTMVDDFLKMGKLKVTVLSTDSHWFGVTYQADKPEVAQSLKKLHENGIYPVTLRKE